MGVPYARKYHEPGTDDFKSPLFLDCCALVRRGQHDLQEEFGFRLGRWNQAYQYDTLAKLGSCKRITVRASGDETEDDPMPAGVRPGDLVFIEGVYTNPKKRQQVHCITHVEVCLGTGEFGEETLGARWQKGQVQVHPSFRFASSSYTIKAFHFCSIDAWLDGVCKSHCKEHEWRDDRVTWQPGATSVFAAADSDDEDEALPGDDSKEHDAEFSAKSGEAADGANAATSTRSERGVETPRFFVNKSNGWDMVVDALRRRGWSQLPFKNNFSNAFELKWVERRSQIDFGAFREGEQLVNHIPNNDVMTSKSNLISLLADLSSDGEDVSFFPQSYRLDIAADRLRFFKDRIDAAASAANGAAASATLSADENFAVEMSFLLDAADATGKSHLDKILETSGNGREGGSDASVEAPDLDSPDGALCTDGYWICKPSSSNRGRGIHVVRDLRSLYRDIMRSAPEHDEGKGGSGIDRWLPSAASIGRNDDVGDMIIQRYIHTPLLLEGNRKFDIRVYALIARTAPTMLVYYHQGYVRLSLEGYTMDDDRLDDRFVHLTNAAVQKKHADYKTRESIWSMDRLRQHLECETSLAPAGFVDRRLPAMLKSAMATVIHGAAKRLERRRGYFDLLGFDFMLDDTLDLHLIEVNTNPALHKDCDVLRDHFPPMVDEALELTLGAFHNDEFPRRSTDDDSKESESPATDKAWAKNTQPLDGDCSVRDKFEVILDEAAGFRFKLESE